MNEELKIHVLLWKWNGPSENGQEPFRGEVAVCQMVRGILPPVCKFSLEFSFLHPVPDSETGSWQFRLPWTSAHPWATLARTGGMEALGLPESCPGLCQDRRSKITQSCFWSSRKGGPLLCFLLLSICGTVGQTGNTLHLQPHHHLLDKIMIPPWLDFPEN